MICAIAVIIAIVMSVMKIWGGEIITYSSVLITLASMAVVLYVLSMLLSICIEKKKVQ